MKIYKLIISFLFILFYCSCQNNVGNDFDRTKLILGKWEIIADGYSEDTIIERNEGSCYEFLPDGTMRIFSCLKLKNINDDYFTWEGKYSIDSDFLICKYYTEDGTCYNEDRYRYEFKEKKLKLTKDPMWLIDMNPGVNNSYIYITNIIIFKQI